MMLMRQHSVMKDGGNPRNLVSEVSYQEDFAKYQQDDFANFYSATENIMSSSGTGTLEGNQSLQELYFLTTQRLGVGNNITQGFSEDALFNWFDPKKVDSKNSLVKIPGFKKWIRDTDFKNQSIQWNTDKRKFGIGFLVKFWSNNDNLSLPAPRGPPLRFQVLSPLYLAPIDTYRTRMLDYDEEMWTFMGGNLKVSQIHRSRVEVLRGPPQVGTFRGLSVIEPIYLALICYYNILINATKATAKWSSVVPVLHGSSVTPTTAEYTEFLSLMTEFVANNFFFLGKDDKLEFPTTNIGDGIYNLAELFKEDISAGTRIPLNELFGRTESGGISGTGNLTAERKYINLFATEQTKISDDFLRIFSSAGFDFEDKDLKWQLALQKTTEQQLLEEQQELNNTILKKQIKQMSQESKMLDAQQEMYEKYKDQLSPDQKLAHTEQIKEDFDYRNKKYQDFQVMNDMMRLRRKVA